MQLIEWNRRGLIPGPEQTEMQFMAKVALLEGLASDKIEEKQAFERVDQLFGIAPDWLSLIRSRKGLSFWEGAVTWQDTRPEGFSIPAIQIRNDLGDSLLSRLYLVDEMLAHEMVHAVRSDFQEPAFEEILAYQTAEKRWRRYWGPLLQNPRETKVFLGVLLLAVAVQWLGLLCALPSWCSLFLWLPWLCLGLGALRLKKNQAVFQRCLTQIESVLPGLGLALALRLTDAEIRLFAKSSPEEIVAYGMREQKRSLRWKMLAAAYLLPGAATR